MTPVMRKTAATAIRASLAPEGWVARIPAGFGLLVDPAIVGGDSNGWRSEILNRLFQPGDLLLVAAVADGRTVNDSLDQAGLAQDLQMLGEGRLGDRQVTVEWAALALADLGQKLENAVAGRVGDGAQHRQQLLVGSGWKLNRLHAGYPQAEYSGSSRRHRLRIFASEGCRVKLHIGSAGWGRGLTRRTGLKIPC